MFLYPLNYPLKVRTLRWYLAEYERIRMMDQWYGRNRVVRGVP
jgi:hypothetical protein